MPRLSKIGAAALAAFGWTSGTSGPANITATYLAVAGGGAGGSSSGGGGGAGGYTTSTFSLSPLNSYTVIVGAGGVGTTGNVPNANGSNTTISGTGISTVTATGGGGGGSYYTSNGSNGGSGGGGGGSNAGGTGGTGSQGNSGGSGALVSTTRIGGGGGGAGGAGASYSGTGGNGGVGLASSISGSSTYYAGGGGGGINQGGTAGTGGTGGGGAGGAGNPDAVGISGTANTGGGGGGSGGNGGGGNGGSGIVIISYAGAQQFGGGIVTSVGGNTIHTFTTSGTLTPLNSLTASYLIVAGGGAGGGYRGGGGGAGGLLSGSGMTIDTNSTYLVTVGAGGTGNTTGSGTNGANSAFSLVNTAAVGGGGGGSNYGGPGVGSSGGSGGGGTSNGGLPAGGAGTSGQGYAGGAGSGSGFYGAGAGGGAGAVGAAGTSSGGGNGGVGVASSISGTSTYYAGGGGGSCYDTGGVAGTGGNGGGGAGTAGNYTGVSGTAGLGGGGGGAGASGGTFNTAGGNGGSGIVIISYAGATQQMAGGTVTIVGGNVIHTFKSSGYLSPLTFVGNSLRFRSSASAYLNRTPTIAGNQKTWTYSAWIKRGTLGSAQSLLNTGPATSSDSTFANFGFGSGDVLNFQAYSVSWRTTTQVFRDPAAWYHIVLAFDTTQSVAANRIKLYVNGTQVTAFTTSNDPTQNTNYAINQAAAHYLSYPAYSFSYFDGYMSETRFIDGQALAPTAFGSFNSYGVWQPITYGGSYGTNGFYLPFSNKTSTTTLGYDFSPAGNNWTTNNISLTAGSTYDSMTDVPTLTSATAANYAVLNPLSNTSAYPYVPSNGNLSFTANANGNGSSQLGTFAVSSGQWYWEVTPSSAWSGGGCIGIVGTAFNPNFQADSYFWNFSYGYGYDMASGRKNNNNTQTTYGAFYSSGDTIGVALDLNARTLTFYKNGTSQGTAFTGLSGSFFPASYCYSSATGSVNFGQQPFVYTPPSGFVALNTYNL